MNIKIFLLLLGLLLISVKTENGESTGSDVNESGGEPAVDPDAPTNPDGDEGDEGDEGANEEGDGEETPSDKDLCYEKSKDKDGCFKVELSSNDKKCCFYEVTPPEGDKFTKCLPKITDKEKKENEDEGYEIKEECSGKFITTSILALLALLFL